MVQVRIRIIGLWLGLRIRVRPNSSPTSKKIEVYGEFQHMATANHNRRNKRRQAEIQVHYPAN